MTGFPLFWVVLAGACLMLYAVTVPLPYQGETDSFTHDMALYGSAFFGGIAWISYREDQ